MKCNIWANGTFVENAPVKVSIRCIVIVPKKIIVALVKIIHNDGSIKSDNEFAHITLMKGEWKPVQSNDILKTLFNEKMGVRKAILPDIMSDDKYP